MRMLIVIGLPGAGKTTILAEVKNRRKVAIINYGDVATEIAKKEGLLQHRDQVLELPPEKIKELQEKSISAFEDNPRTILDTHALLSLRPSGKLPGLTPSLFKKVKVEALVFIDAPSKEVVDRRKRDTSRKRPTISEEELDRNREESTRMIKVYAEQYTVPFFTITNRDGKLEDAVKEFLNVLDSLGWKD